MGKLTAFKPVRGSKDGGRLIAVVPRTEPQKPASAIGKLVPVVPAKAPQLSAAPRQARVTAPAVAKMDNHDVYHEVKAGTQKYTTVSRAIEESNAGIRYSRAKRAVEEDKHSANGIHSNDFAVREAERQRRENNEAELKAAAADSGRNRGVAGHY